MTGLPPSRSAWTCFCKESGINGFALCQTWETWIGGLKKCFVHWNAVSKEEFYVEKFLASMFDHVTDQHAMLLWIFWMRNITVGKAGQSEKAVHVHLFKVLTSDMADSGTWMVRICWQINRFLFLFQNFHVVMPWFLITFSNITVFNRVLIIIVQSVRYGGQAQVT